MEIQALHEDLTLAIPHNFQISKIKTDAMEIISFLRNLSPLFTNIINACRSSPKELKNP